MRKHFMAIPAILLLMTQALAAQEAAAPCQARLMIEDVYAKAKTAVSTAADDEAMRLQISSMMEGFVDFGEFGKLSLGSTWETLTQAQQETYLAAFQDLLKRTYLKRFSRGKDFTVGFRSDCRMNKSGDRMEIQTTITSGETSADVDYRLHKPLDKWLVYDIVVDEVSIMRNYRKSFTKVVTKDGFEVLIEKMKKSNDDKELD